MKQILLILLMLAYFNSCTLNEQSELLKFKKYSTAECVSIEYSDYLSIPMQMLKKDSLLFINDFRGDSLIHIFNINKNKLIRSLISVGNGPNELISPLEIKISNNSLKIFCRQTFSLYSISIDSINNKNIELQKLTTFPSEASRFTLLTDSLFICSGIFKKRYALFNHKGEMLNEFGEFPVYWIDEKDIPIQARAMFHQTAFSKHPKSSDFISYSAHILEIYSYSLTDSLPSLVKSIPLGDYNYTYTVGNVLSAKRGNNVERGIIDAFSSDKYIYLLYDFSKIHTDSQKKSKILIFDWSGNPIESLELNNRVERFVIDEDNNRGYCIIEDPDYSVAFFDIK